MSGQDSEDLPEDIDKAKKVFQKPAAKEGGRVKADEIQKAKAVKAARERIIEMKRQKIKQKKREEDSNSEDDDFVGVRKENNKKQL